MTQSLAIKGRGATSNPPGRFATRQTEPVGEGLLAVFEPVKTWLRPEAAKSIVSYNQSPDIPFDRSINPYRGCEHGCVYCFARPCHSYVDLSPGLDFERKIFFKDNAAQLLEDTLRRRGYRCRPIAMGTNTDPYQPAESKLKITRGLLEVMVRYRHPVTIVTKSALVQRDLDLLADLAADNLVSVQLSVTTLDDDLKRRLEPRTASGAARLATIERLHEAGIPVGVMVAPVIPAINDGEIESILAAAREAGARRAAYILLRLPHEVKILFRDWLEVHFPARAEHVMSLVRASRGGRDNDPRYGHRMRGHGIFADMIRRRFAKACRDFGLARQENSALAVHHFGVPRERQPQLSLF